MKYLYDNKEKYDITNGDIQSMVTELFTSGLDTVMRKHKIYLIFSVYKSIKPYKGCYNNAFYLVQTCKQ